MTAVNYVFTWNNYTEDELDYVRKLVDTNPRIKYVCFSKEVAPTTGTPHLQGFIGWKAPARHSATMKVLKGHWCERMFGEIAESDSYCSKESEIEMYGSVPDRNVNARKRKKGGEANRERWRVALEAGKSGDYTNVDPEILIRYGGALQRAAQLLLPPAEDIDGDMEHEWHYGPAGKGKSSSIRKKYKDSLFVKKSNKWWNGYMGQENVLIEDMDPHRNNELIEDLKVWADRYKYAPETKGGFLKEIRPKRIIVTSQYTLDECFPGRDCDAFKRRFKVIDYN